MVSTFIKVQELRKIEELPWVTRDRAEAPQDIEKTVREILENIKTGGDRAVLNYVKKFDGYQPRTIKDIMVSGARLKNSAQKAEVMYPRLIKSLKKAYRNISIYHRHQLDFLKKSWNIRPGNGREAGQFIKPVDRVGLYIPGGRYLYPSSVLMAATPAIIAGVKEIVLCSPPNKGGHLNDVLLYICGWLGINEIYKIGGAQAVGLMAYGSESINKVDKVAGPGNTFVTEAKRQVFGTVGIDSLAGPSDVTILSDGSGNPCFAAYDMLAQSEHDPESRSTLLTTSMDFANSVIDEICRGLEALPTDKEGNHIREILGISLKKNCHIIYASDMEDLIKLCNLIAPEHLEIVTRENKKILKGIRNAGAIFLGEYSPVALGDYLGGPNHIIPTGGSARFSSPLGVYDFIKRSSYILYNRRALKEEKEYIKEIARYEGLNLHADSICVRFKKNNKIVPGIKK